MDNQPIEKTLTVDPEAARLLQEGHQEGHYYKLELIPCGWSSPSFRLVQTKELEADDGPIRDPKFGITVYCTEFIAQFFQDLEIFPSRVMDDGSLVIRDRPF